MDDLRCLTRQQQHGASGRDMNSRPDHTGEMIFTAGLEFSMMTRGTSKVEAHGQTQRFLKHKVGGCSPFLPPRICVFEQERTSQNWGREAQKDHREPPDFLQRFILPR